MSIISIEEYTINLIDGVPLNMGCLPFPDKTHEIDVTTTSVYETLQLQPTTTVVMISSAIDKRIAVAFENADALSQPNKRILMDVAEKRHVLNVGKNSATKIYIKDAADIFTGTLGGYSWPTTAGDIENAIVVSGQSLATSLTHGTLDGSTYPIIQTKQFATYTRNINDNPAINDALQLRTTGHSIGTIALNENLTTQRDIVGYNYGAKPISWWDDGSDGWTDLIAGLDAIGSFNDFVWIQGTADVLLNTQKVAYQAKLQSLFDRLKTRYTGSWKFHVAIHARNLDASNPTRKMNIRNAQADFAAANADAYQIAPLAVSQYDFYHPNGEGLVNMGRMIGYALQSGNRGITLTGVNYITAENKYVLNFNVASGRKLRYVGENYILPKNITMRDIANNDIPMQSVEIVGNTLECVAFNAQTNLANVQVFTNLGLRQTSDLSTDIGDHTNALTDDSPLNSTTGAGMFLQHNSTSIVPTVI